MKTIHELYQQILQEGGTPSTLFLLLAERREAGELNGLIQECIRALSLHPGDIRIRHLLAEACLESGWYSRAESEAETLTAEIEKLIPAYRLKAEIFFQGHRKQEACSALQIYLAHRPEDKEAAELLEMWMAPVETPVGEPFPEPAPEPETAPPLQVAGPETQERAPLLEIATPTLAEVYFSQGQLPEAVATYEKFLAQNPGAEGIRLRLEELKALNAPPPSPHEGEKADPGRREKERTIALLDAWRSRLREMPRGTTPP